MTKNFSFIRFVWGLILKRPWHYAGGVLSVVILDAIDMLPALIVKQVTDEVQASPQNVDVTVYALALAGCYFLISLLRMSWRFFLMIPSRSIEAELRQDAYERILYSDFAEASQLKTGDVVSTLSQDLTNIRMFMGPGILVLFDSLAYLIFIPITLVNILGHGAFWVLLPFTLLAVTVLAVQKPLERAYEIISDRLGDLSQYVYEEAQGSRFFRAEGLIEIRRKKYDIILQSIFHKQLEISKWELGLDGTLQTVIQSSYLTVLIMAFQGHGEMAKGLGALTVSLQLLDKLLWPLMSVSYLMNLYQQANTGGRRLMKLQTLPLKRMNGLRLKNPVQKIKIRNLSLVAHQTPILQDINLTITPGEHVAIVGAVGSGKTVLLQTLAGLWEDSNLIYDQYSFDEVDFKNLDRKSWWDQVSFIPQTPQIFGQSLAMNISPRAPIHTESLLNALEKADLRQDVSLFPEGLNTHIGEKGINLSGGQKQRTLIARSFHSMAHVFLWDDAISALDPATEKKVIQNLRQLDAKAILILATHRLSSLKSFDRIIVLEGGRIVREGSFEEIKRDHALFASLLRDEKESHLEEDAWT